jgi:hypothetical protein
MTAKRSLSKIRFDGIFVCEVSMAMYHSSLPNLDEQPIAVGELPRSDTVYGATMIR